VSCLFERASSGGRSPVSEAEGLKRYVRSTRTEQIRRLFEAHVPEVVSGLIEIRGFGQDPGVLSLVLVHATVESISNTVGAWVDDRGVHNKRIQQELGRPELLSVVRWSDSLEQFFGNVLSPNRIVKLSLDAKEHTACVVARAPSNFPPSPESPLVQTARLRLASGILGWSIQIESSQIS